MLFTVIRPLAATLPVACVAMLRPSLNPGARGQGIVRVSMASQAIAHAHGHVLINNVHGLHFAVACLAENAGAHMGSVIKKDVIRQRMDSRPFQRLA